jgi:hypothetical protein
MFDSFVQLFIIGGMNNVELSNAKLPNQQDVLNICEGALLIIKPTCGPPRKGACEIRLTNQ